MSSSFLLCRFVLASFHLPILRCTPVGGGSAEGRSLPLLSSRARATVWIFRFVLVFLCFFLFFFVFFVFCYINLLVCVVLSFKKINHPKRDTLYPQSTIENQTRRHA